MGLRKQLITGTSGHVLDMQTSFLEATLTGSCHGVRMSSVPYLAGHVQKTNPIAVHMELISTKRRVDSNVEVQLTMHLIQE